MSECRKAFEARFRSTEWTQETWLVWRLAWNAAIRQSNIQNNLLVEPI